MIPSDLIELGAVRGAYGTKGWVRIAPFTSDGTVLESVRRWWLRHGGATDVLNIEEVKPHGASIVAKWRGCESKEAADALNGAVIAVPRSQFPPLAAGEHYLSDVIGYRVVNREDVELGRVSGLRTGGDANATNQWLEVLNQTNSKVMLIPLIDQYIDTIDPAAGIVKVDWRTDW